MKVIMMDKEEIWATTKNASHTCFCLLGELLGLINKVLTVDLFLSSKMHCMHHFEDNNHKIIPTSHFWIVSEGGDKVISKLNDKMVQKWRTPNIFHETKRTISECILSRLGKLV